MGKKIIITVISFLLILLWIQIAEMKQLQQKRRDMPVFDTKSYESESEPKIIHRDVERKPVQTTTETTETPNKYIGTFRLTAYCSCRKCCEGYADNRPIDENGNEIVYGAIGEILTEGYSIAVDPKVIPYRTEVLIDGNVYKAQDCGGAIKGNEIDVYFSDHQSAKEFGVQYKDVYIIGG